MSENMPTGNNDIPPGWYADPTTPNSQRYWDGGAWTSQQVIMPSTVNVQTEVGKVEKYGRWASISFIVGFFAYAANSVFGILVGQSMRKYLNDLVVYDKGFSEQRPEMGIPFPLNILNNISQLVILVAGILFLVWFYNAVKISYTVGVLARLSPVWAILGFIIPIINFWFPYQSASDIFPKEYTSQRSLITRWWLCWIFASLLTVPTVIFSFLSDQIVAAIIFSTISVILYAAAAIFGRQMIREVSEYQKTLT